MTRPSEGQATSEGVKQETIGETNNLDHHHHQQQLQQQSQNQNQNDNNRPKRNPFCSRCRNHGKSAQVKGHKRHCEYRDCQCEGCKLVEWRQIVSARQIKRRRYQKQDEECGRSIEVSPPVLTRDSNSDLAALIDKTLIGASESRHLSVPYNNNNTSSTNNNNKQQQPLIRHQALSRHNSHADQLHLFNFSNSVLSAAAAASFGTVQQPSVLIPPVYPSSSTAAPNSPPLPSFREQLALVEEIYSSFGPLAIFAWLKTERFDIRKVHNLIELSRVTFDELLQSTHNNNTDHSPLDLTSPIVD